MRAKRCNADVSQEATSQSPRKEPSHGTSAPGEQQKLNCKKKASRSALPARRKIPTVNYSAFFSAFGFFGGRSFFAAALAGAASPVFAEAASLPFCGAAPFGFGALSGGSIGSRTRGGRLAQA